MSSNLVGQTLLKQFRVDAFIASGGMGVVYRVWDLKRNTSLAMKVINADLAEDRMFLRRFKREAQTLARLRHPNIVPSYGLYQMRDTSFLLELFIDGLTLKEVFNHQQDRRFTYTDILIFMKVLCAALGYAHVNGMVHCDVKPGNVMIDRGGNIYLADFGISRHMESTTTTMPSVGTAAYMAPEQIRGEAVGPETDVYSLGVMLFEMFTGKRPFRGDESGTESAGTTAGERIRYGHLMLPPPDPQLINPDLPDELAKVILKALSKDPAHRYSGVLELYQALCAVLGVRPESVPDRVVLPKGYWKEDEVTFEKPVDQRARMTPWVMGGTFVLIIFFIFFAFRDDDSVSDGELIKTLTAREIEAVRVVDKNIPTLTEIPFIPTNTFRPTQTRYLISTSTRRLTSTARPRPTNTQDQGPWLACQGSNLSRLHIGDRAYVSYEPPKANNVRTGPGLDYKKIGEIQPGVEIVVLDGPSCRNNYVWWRIRSDESNLTGWTAEGDYEKYWLVPIP